MAADKIKRVSHKNCNHPATSHERAKCRARIEAAAGLPQLSLIDSEPEATRPLADVAKQLGEAISARNSVESRLTEHDRTVQSLQEELAATMLGQEPKSTSDGRPPVIAFRKMFREHKCYDYTSVGVDVTVSVEELNDQFSFRPVYTKKMWFLSSSSGNTTNPKTWSELVKFMGVDGLRTLEVLRAG